MITPVGIAIACHNVNRAYCEALGDYSVPPWESAPSWQRESIIDGVLMHLANPNATAEDSHKSWLKQKLAAGWVYGPNKDPEKKEHPCIVPYKDLPKEQQVKDYLFKAVVRSLAEHTYEQGAGESKTGDQNMNNDQGSAVEQQETEPISDTQGNVPSETIEEKDPNTLPDPPEVETAEAPSENLTEPTNETEAPNAPRDPQGASY